MSDKSRIHTDEAWIEGPNSRLFRRSVFGEGPFLARVGLVHGYGEHSGRHLRLLTWLAERGVACHAVDLRGQGRSDGPRGAVRRWDDYLGDIAAFLNDLSLGSNGTEAPLFLIGHSHGGLVLTLAVLRKVAEARGIILSAPYFGNRVPIPAWKSHAARLLSPIAPALRMHSGLKHEWMSRDEAMVRESRADPLICKTATPRWFLGCADARREALRRAPEFRLPLLLLQGEKDSVSDPETSFRFANSVGAADCTVKRYPEMLHELFREQGREQVYADVLEWINARATSLPAPTKLDPG
jgi:lysophospholipase